MCEYGFLNFNHSKDYMTQIWAVVINVSGELFVLIISSVT